jgi:hypothetical protein
LNLEREFTEIWPNLEVYFHGGVNFDPYRTQYNAFYLKDFKYYEIYNASEGFCNSGLNNSSDLLLMLDYGFSMNLFRWILWHINQKAIRLCRNEQNYAIVITTNSGLWRYLIGDTVRFTSLQPLE